MYHCCSFTLSLTSSLYSTCKSLHTFYSNHGLSFLLLIPGLVYARFCLFQLPHYRLKNKCISFSKIYSCIHTKHLCEYKFEVMNMCRSFWKAIKVPTKPSFKITTEVLCQQTKQIQISVKQVIRLQLPLCQICRVVELLLLKPVLWNLCLLLLLLHQLETMKVPVKSFINITTLYYYNILKRSVIVILNRLTLKA